MNKTLTFYNRKSCPLCSNKKSTVLYKGSLKSGSLRDFLNQYYELGQFEIKFELSALSIRKCENCHTIFQNECLDDESAEYFYDKICNSNISLEKKSKASFRYFNSVINNGKAISRFFGVKEYPSDIHILDFGMGWGYWARGISALGYSVYGTEFSHKRVQHASSLGIKNVNPFDGSFQFDFVNLDQVLEHLPKPIEILNSLARAIKINGLIQIGVPRGNKTRSELIKGIWMPKKDAMHPLEHLNLFKKKYFEKKMNQLGFKKLSIVQHLKNGFSVKRLVDNRLHGSCSAVYQKVK